MSLSCTVATTRDDESLRPRVVPVLCDTLVLRAKQFLLIDPYRPALGSRIESKSSSAHSLHKHFRLSLTLLYDPCDRAQPMGLPSVSE